MMNRSIATLVAAVTVWCFSGNDLLAQVRGWVVYPEKEWRTLTPAEAGLDAAKFEAWAERQRPRFGTAYGGQQPERGGVVMARGGYLIRTWGEPEFRSQSASLGKTFTRMALQLAVDDGLIENPEDLVRNYWSGADLLEPHKVMTAGHNAEVSFDHLQTMTAGFPVSNGYLWRTKDATGILGPKAIPRWAKYTGDPDHDNYAHVEPGTQSRYSSGGYWRLSQALTAVWKQDLKDLLDQRIMSRIGIPADRWEWLTGEQVRKDVDFYPEMPGYGGYLDAPYRIDGIPVRGGPGWVVMSAKDFARVGLLIATEGIWNGERLISKVEGNRGVGANTMDGWSAVNGKDGYFSFGKVATKFDDPTPNEMASWIVGPSLSRLEDVTRRHAD